MRCRYVGNVARTSLLLAALSLFVLLATGCLHVIAAAPHARYEQLRVDFVPTGAVVARTESVGGESDWKPRVASGDHSFGL